MGLRRKSKRRMKTNKTRSNKIRGGKTRGKSKGKVSLSLAGRKN